MKVRSMTGFARVRKPTPDGELVLSLKSVNHRGLDLHFHLPAEMDAYENAVRSLVKTGVARGHLQLHAGLTRTGGGVLATLNRPLLEAYMGAFEQARREFNLECRPDLNAAMRVPGMFSTETPELDSEYEKILLAATSEALEALNQFREREGGEIAQEMKSRSVNIRTLAADMEKIRSQATAAFQKRLRQKLSELLHGTSVEPQRLAQEAALLAERSDVSEELARLRTHAAEVEGLLKKGGEVGKKLDFLLQEMNRESNTILSKTSGLGDTGLKITELALAAKAEIDKIREQSLNLE
jgi:uncharacterized protein (TIGR00255 family)